MQIAFNNIIKNLSQHRKATDLSLWVTTLYPFLTCPDLINPIFTKTPFFIRFDFSGWQMNEPDLLVYDLRFMSPYFHMNMAKICWKRVWYLPLSDLLSRSYWNMKQLVLKVRLQLTQYEKRFTPLCLSELIRVNILKQRYRRLGFPK